MRETWVWSLGWEIPWRRERPPTPVFWLGEFHGPVHGVSESRIRLSDFHFHFPVSGVIFPQLFEWLLLTQIISQISPSYGVHPPCPLGLKQPLSVTLFQHPVFFFPLCSTCCNLLLLCPHSVFIRVESLSIFSLLCIPRNKSIYHWAELMIFCHYHLHRCFHNSHLSGTHYLPGIVQSAVFSCNRSKISKGGSLLLSIFISTLEMRKLRLIVIPRVVPVTITTPPPSSF